MLLSSVRVCVYVTKDAGEYAGQVNPECHLQKHHPLP